MLPSGTSYDDFFRQFLTDQGYIFRKFLSEGAAGKVILADRPLEGGLLAPVAIKIPLPTYRSDPRQNGAVVYRNKLNAQMLYSEYVILATLCKAASEEQREHLTCRHLSLHQHKQNRNVVALVMEFIEVLLLCVGGGSPPRPPSLASRGRFSTSTIHAAPRDNPRPCSFPAPVRAASPPVQPCCCTDGDRLSCRKCDRRGERRCENGIY